MSHATLRRLAMLTVVTALLGWYAAATSAAPSRQRQTRQVGSAPPPRRRVAVVLSGGIRTLLWCNHSFFEHVAWTNPEFDFDFFAYAVVDLANEHERAALDALRRSGARALEWISPIESRRAVLRDLPTLARLPEGNGTARGTATNVASMFRSIALADGLRREYERASGARYDLVMRARPDMRWCAPLNLSAALRVLATHRGAVLVPFAEDHLVFDQLAIATPATMVSYASGYESTLRDEIDRHTRSREDVYISRISLLLRSYLEKTTVLYSSLRTLARLVFIITPNSKSQSQHFMWPVLFLLRDLARAGRARSTREDARLRLSGTRTTATLSSVAGNPLRALYPEVEMWRHFHSLKLRTITMRDFRGTLVRAGSGRRHGVYQEDAFVKLRLDYPNLARIAMPPLVTRAQCGSLREPRGP